MPICPLCKNEVIELTEDHIVPKAMGGAGKGHGNIQMICQNCNALKNVTIDRLLYRMWQGWYDDPLLQKAFNPKYKGELNVMSSGDGKGGGSGVQGDTATSSTDKDPTPVCAGHESPTPETPEDKYYCPCGGDCHRSKNPCSFGCVEHHERWLKEHIMVGDFYEDCAGHTCLCTLSEGDDIEGISLIDGTEPRSCSLKSCCPPKLTALEAIENVKLFKELVTWK